MMPRRSFDNIDSEANNSLHQTAGTQQQSTTNQQVFHQQQYARNARSHSTMNTGSVMYHQPLSQNGFHHGDMGHDPRRFGMMQTNQSMNPSVGLVQMDHQQQSHQMMGMQNIPQHQMTVRNQEHMQQMQVGNGMFVPDNGAGDQRAGPMGQVGNMITNTPNNFINAGVDMSSGQMQQLHGTNSSQQSGMSQAEQEEDLLLQLLIARRNRSQQMGTAGHENVSLADDFMRLRQNAGMGGTGSLQMFQQVTGMGPGMNMQPGGFLQSQSSYLNQGIMEQNAGLGMRQFPPELGGRIDKGPGRMIDARTQDTIDVSNRVKRAGFPMKFGQVDSLFMGHDVLSPPKKQKRTQRKKPADMPRRPLSAYNLFFSEERERILKEMSGEEEKHEETTSPPDETDDTDKEDKSVESKNEGDDKPKAFLRPLIPTQKKRRPHRKTHGVISFQQLARMVGERWKNLADDRRKYYQELARQDMARQKQAMEKYYAKQNKDKEERGKKEEKLDETMKHESTGTGAESSDPAPRAGQAEANESSSY